jgi:malate dehydrogenase
MKDWTLGNDDWHSIAIKTNGKLYGIPEGIFFSFPCTSSNGKYSVVDQISLDDEEV